MRVLYLSYDGLLEPLGQSQVLRYLERLARKHKIFVISFEKPREFLHKQLIEDQHKHMAMYGITWIPLRYHKNPSVLATMIDIAQGSFVGLWIVLRFRITIVHARSYVLSLVALPLKLLFRTRYIFDMRGFWADERIDGGIWSGESKVYKVAKWFERHFLRNSDCVVSLTQAAIEEMSAFPYLQGRKPRFECITTCADLDLFCPGKSASSSNSVKRPFTLGYVGSVGVWYLFDETLRCFQILRERQPGARLHILNRGGHDLILERLSALGIDPASVKLEATDHEGVARAMQQMNAGVFFIKPVYSKIASAPTKLGEFLGCGVPCLGNTGVGDMASILEGEQVGVTLSCFDETAMREAVDRLLQLTNTPGIQERCRDVALRYFSLEEGVRAYDRIYRELGDLNA